MIRVTVELVPGGVGAPEHLGTMTVARQGPAARSNTYLARFFNRRRVEMRRKGVVQGHRRDEEPVWSLVRKALQDAGY